MKSSWRARAPPGVSGTLCSVRILRIGKIGSVPITPSVLHPHLHLSVDRSFSSPSPPPSVSGSLLQPKLTRLSIPASICQWIAPSALHPRLHLSVDRSFSSPSPPPSVSGSLLQFSIPTSICQWIAPSVLHPHLRLSVDRSFSPN